MKELRGTKLLKMDYKALALTFLACLAVAAANNDIYGKYLAITITKILYCLNQMVFEL
jgi:hypothetical protein